MPIGARCRSVPFRVRSNSVGGLLKIVTVPGSQQSLAATVRGWMGRNRLAGQTAWVAVPFATQQLIKLVSQVVLTRLLAPEMFGIMLLVYTLRTGTELLSDIGIGQSIVRSPRGEERRFLDTAWTLQVLRGVLLAAAAIALAGPIGHIYGQPELTPILIAVSPVFLFTGLQSPSLFIVQRQMRLRARAAYDLGCAAFQASFTIALAAVMPSVWALVWSLVATTMFGAVVSYLIGDRRWPRLAWDKSAASEILHFGKWIFLSTMVYFAATSTDRFYFVAVLPLALVGVYSIARTLADLFDQLGGRAGSMIVFPRFAALGERRGEAALGLRAKRRSVLAVMAAGGGAAIAVSDQLMLILYDPRYHLAGFMLPLLLTGVWFRVLGTFGDAMLMGCGRPAPAAFANAAKFAILLVGLPLAIGQANLFTALLVLILSEAGRWAVMALVLQRERLATITDDLALTALVAGSAVVCKLAAGAVGLAPTIAEWWALGEPLRG